MTATTPWWDQPVTVLDTETTGPDPDRDRIVSVYIGRVHPDGHAQDLFCGLVAPEVPIPEFASAIHGISDAHARQYGFPAQEVIPAAVRILRAAQRAGEPVVAYNAPFDLTILDREARRVGTTPLTPTRVLDPLVLDFAADPNRPGSRKLSAVCSTYDVPLEAAHTADCDAIAAGRLAFAVATRFQLPADLDRLHTAQVTWRTRQVGMLNARRALRGARQITSAAWPVEPLPLGWQHAA